ncbi:MAG: site-specific DNA-methyltransferase [Paracoccaceae bacterium]|nr:site-specific DNA-methyltransferase [Paracoccaceae bacterium]MDE2917031.1 site-specific DNA-methyltransferase [Paracoccaceae bacterium]
MSNVFFQNKELTIFNEDILTTNCIGRSSVDLIVTSPPYNVGIDYSSNSDELDYYSYLTFSKKWLRKCYRWSKDGGRLCLNIPLDKNKGGQQSVCADLTKIAKDVGWSYHSTIIWNEGNISRRTAWGSWLSASAPYVIAPVEVIVIMYKNQWKRKEKGTNDISREEFMEWTNGLWTFNGQSKKGAGGHPAAFPVELPKRCIKLFSFVGDTVLDPFLGSGSSIIAANQCFRRGIGIEIDEDYCNIALQRLKKEARVFELELALTK